MRKRLFFYILILSACFLTACSDDDNDMPTLSFGRPIYVLKPVEALAVEIISSVPVTREVMVPFDISGTAIPDEDYTIEAGAFTLQPGQTIDTVWITPRENVVAQREIRLALREVEGFQLWNNRVAMIPVETKDIFTCSFAETKYDLKKEIVVKTNLFVGGSSYMYKRVEVRVPFEIDPASTAIEGEHYEIVGDNKELFMDIMKATADVTLRFLKHEEGKDVIIMRLVESGIFESGTNASTRITVSGPTTFKALVGKWAYREFTSESLIRRMAFNAAECANLPLDNRTTDMIQFIEGGTNTLNIEQVQGDLAKYLRNCDVTMVDEGPWTLYDQNNMPVRDVLTLELSKANVNYSVTNVNERKATVGVRFLNNGNTLELRIIDYEPTDFLQDSYYDAMHPWHGGDPDEFPMKDLYPFVFLFDKVE